MTQVLEQDFPPGHPKRFDYDPKSPEAIEWARVHSHPKGERDWPVDHVNAVDTPGNKNSITWQPGVDPFHPELEAFTGRTPEQAAAVRALEAEASAKAKPSPILPPVIAPDPEVIKARVRELMQQGNTEARATEIAVGEMYDKIKARAVA
jgi:hypothetical protein